jgi:hypothetical protein
VWLFLPAALPIAAISAEALSKKVIAHFPVARSVLRDHRRRVAIALAILFGAPIIFGALAALTNASILAAPAAIGVLTGLVLLIRTQSWIQGRLDRHGVVKLRKVSPEWAAQRQALVNYCWTTRQQYAAQQYAAQQQAYAAQPYAAQPYGSPDQSRG